MPWHLSYLAILLVSTACMALCDQRWRLAFFRHPSRAAALSVGCVTAMLAWDALGIVTGTFFRGGSAYMTGIELAPEMPLEEPIFLFFLTYLALNLTTVAQRGTRRQRVATP